MQVLTNKLIATLAFSNALQSVYASSKYLDPDGNNSVAAKALDKSSRSGASSLGNRFSIVGLKPTLRDPKSGHGLSNTVTIPSDPSIGAEELPEPQCNNNEMSSVLKDINKHIEERNRERNGEHDDERKAESRGRYAKGVSGVILTGIGMGLAGFFVRECQEDWIHADGVWLDGQIETINTAAIVFIALFLAVGLGLLASTIATRDSSCASQSILGVTGALAGGSLALGMHFLSQTDSPADIALDSEATMCFISSGILLGFLLLFATFKFSKFSYSISLLHFVGGLSLLAGCGVMTYAIAEDVTAFDFDPSDADGLSTGPALAMFFLLLAGGIWFSFTFGVQFSESVGWAAFSLVGFCTVAATMTAGSHLITSGEFGLGGLLFGVAAVIFVALMIMKYLAYNKRGCFKIKV